MADGGGREVTDEPGGRARVFAGGEGCGLGDPRVGVGDESAQCGGIGAPSEVRREFGGAASHPGFGIGGRSPPDGGGRRARRAAHEDGEGDGAHCGRGVVGGDARDLGPVAAAGGLHGSLGGVHGRRRYRLAATRRGGRGRLRGVDANPPVVEPAARRPSRGWRIVVGVLVVCSLVGCAGYLWHVPYTTISPGSSVALAERVTIEGAETYPEPRGDVRLLFVRERNNVNAWEYLRARWDGDTEIIDDEVATGGQPSADLAAEAYADMASAKLAATKVALERAGYRVPPPRGALVLATLPSRPGASVLREGDVILAVDGRPIVTTGDLGRAVDAGTAGAVVPVVVRRDGKRKTVDVRYSLGPEGGTVIGVRVFPAFSFPVEVEVDTEGIGGPSAGLAMTLAILDDLTPGDLTGGRRVAATGTIDERGRVGPIGGLRQKGVSARAAGASVFLVPACPIEPASAATACRNDLRSLRERAGRGVAVVPVADIGEALEALRERGGAPVVPVAGADSAAAA